MEVGELESPPRSAIVTFADGTESGRIPVALLDRLDKTAQPPLRKGDEKTLTEMAEITGFSVARLRLLMRLEAFVGRAAQLAVARPGVEPAPPKTAAPEEDRILTPEEMRRIVRRTSHQVEQRRTATFHELRSNFLRFVTRSGAERRGTGNGSGAGQKGTKSENSRRAEDERKKDLMFLLQVGHMLCEDAAPEKFTDREHLALFRDFILAVLDASEGGDDDQVDDRLLPANSMDSTGGWVRLLGRLIVTHCEAWMKPGVIQSEIDRESVEILGLILEVSSVVVATATAQNMHKSVISPLLRSVKSFEEKALLSLPAGTGAGDYLASVRTDFRSIPDIERLSRLP